MRSDWSNTYFAWFRAVAPNASRRDDATASRPLPASAQ